MVLFSIIFRTLSLPILNNIAQGQQRAAYEYCGSWMDTNTGALKMTDIKLQDMKLTD